MNILGVIDLLDGRAVHARAGDRERYAPVTQVAGISIESGSALALAREYIDRFSLTDLYIADLDAIRGHPAQTDSLIALAALGARLWVDAGVSSVDEARRVSGCGAAHVIVGLETLSSYAALDQIC